MDKVEIVVSEGPVELAVVDFELAVWGDEVGLDGAVGWRLD